MGDADGFELQYSGKVNNLVPVYKYRSKNTGLRVVIAQVEGPIVNGYFCLATEAHDDDGLPHTLEHLVFMGSELYPYKGVLDLLANRCLASGTNAWTDTDHTCYTMTTAGSEGFLNLMPVFLDHVLYPTITEAGYITEVHHVNGEGEDAGVVYCEMQARENTGESLCHLALLRAMYPDGCGYRSETGGILENLRTSTSHAKVCSYHQQFYQPENMCLVITGQVQPDQVFKSLRPFEDRIIGKGRRPVYKRPWQSAVPPLVASVEQVVPYPSDDEEHGMVMLAWRGPRAKELYQMSAVLMLLEYLTDTSVAPLQRDFVEIDNPYCSKVRYSIIENSEGCIYIAFENVPREKIVAIKDRAVDLLVKLNTEKEKVDMTRMHNVIHRRILEALSALEDQPHDTVAFHAIGDFLYGNTTHDMDQRLNQIATFRQLDKEPTDFWPALIKQYFVDKEMIVIHGVPSKKLMEEMGATEKQRVAAQHAALGDQGLKTNAEQLEKATNENEREPPEEVITNMDVPDIGCIQFHRINPSTNRDEAAANANAKFPLADIPVTFQLDDIKTNFVNMFVLMNSETIPSKLRYYLPLYVELLTESAIVRDGVLVSHEDVINQLTADTVYNSGQVGISGGRFSTGAFGQLTTLFLKVEVEKYTKGVQWLRELLYQIQFAADRVKIVATKMANDVSRLKRKGPFLVKMLMRDVLYKKDSNEHLSSMLRQHAFLTGLVDKMGKPDQAQQVLADLNKLRDLLTTPSNMTVHVSAHLDTLSEPQQVWTKEFLPKDLSTEGERPAVKKPYEFLNGEGEGPGSGIILGVGAVESSFLIQTGPCEKDPDHADIPAVMVFKQYLTQLEGPMWRQIRGLGLSYHYSIYEKPEAGLIYFILYKSTHLVNAYKQAKEIVDGYLDGSTPFSEVELETSKSSLVFEIIEELRTPQMASMNSLTSYFKGVATNYNKQTIEKVSKVTIEDLKRVGPKYFAPLFDTKTSKCAICCHPTKVAEITKDFKELSRELKVVESMEESFLAEL